MREKDPLADSAEPGADVAVTEPGKTQTGKTRKGSRPSFAAMLSLGLAACVMILGFQNCAVDLTATTPGASTTGACGNPTAQELSDIQPVITGVLSTSCASCHGVTTGSVSSPFTTPDAGADASLTSTQSFAYTQLCVRGGKAVGLKIDGTSSHGGDTFTRGGGTDPLYNYLDTHF